ncbi:MAG: hypothetical protein QOF72_2172 [Blastocatellia bacterium]|nr:hypothetical protein [Blastocatellia bacterium]
MLPPNVKTLVKDEKRKITYEIWSYRKLTDYEINATIAGCWRAKRKKDRPHPGQTIVIRTIFH